MDTVDVPDVREFAGESFEKTNLFETDRMFSDVYCFEPGQAQTPHVHDDADKVYYVLEGSGTFRVGEEERTLERGTAVVAPAGERHGVRNDGPDRLRTLVFLARDRAPPNGASDDHGHESPVDHAHGAEPTSDDAHSATGEHGHRLPHDHSGEGSESDVAIVTVSTSRFERDDADDDPSGDAIRELAREAGHTVVSRTLVPDDTEEITAAVEAATADGADVVVTTGGTGLTPDDVTVEALRPLFDREIPGFGEAFRRRSERQVGLAGLVSRSTAGVVDETLVFVLPGSEDAVRLGVGELVVPQLDHLLHQVRR